MSARSRLTTCDGPEHVAQAAAETVADALRDALERRGVAHLALSGGTTVVHLYDALGPLLGDWTGVHLWYGDERMVPFDDPESTHRLARERLAAPGATWHPVRTELSPQAAAAAYAQELANVTLDAAINGMGPDGHTASLFPGHPGARAEGIAVAVLDAPKPPPERVSLTLPTFNAAGLIALVVTGAEKAPMLARVLAGPDDALPASLLARDRLRVFADGAAAGA